MAERLADLKFELRDDEMMWLPVRVLGFQRASALLDLSEGVYEVEITVDDPSIGFEDELIQREIEIHEDVIQTVVLEGY